MSYDIVIPARERLDNIRATLDSIYKQSITPKQVIIIDDGSDDGLDKLAKEYGYDYAKFHKA